MSSNIIEFNGKRYDALTGTFLGESKVSAEGAVVHGPVRHRGRSLDGFVKTSRKVSKDTTQPRLTVIPVQPAPPDVPGTTSETPRGLHRAHQAARHAAAHRPQRAKTLMRTAVAKPNLHKLKAQLPAEMMAKPPGVLAPKLSVSKIDPRRNAHAQEIAQSTGIKKFSSSRQLESAVRPIVVPVRGRTAKPALARPHAHVAASNAPKPDIFEAAIAHATSHEQLAPAHVSKKQRARRRIINAVAGIGALLLIGSFVAYLNLPNIELKVASVRAGFHATLPNYQPTGYALDGRVQSHSNQVTVSFRSGNGNSFKLTQQPSNWNSATLYDNVVAIAGSQHQTIETAGRTIYLYGGTNATWVNGGIWYQLISDAQLSNDQITRLATSM